jgi:hypothetical protein
VGGRRGVKGGLLVRLATLLPPVSRLSRENVGTSTSHNPMGSSRPVTMIALPFFTFTDDIKTPTMVSPPYCDGEV